jgi:hypothetical protein
VKRAMEIVVVARALPQEAKRLRQERRQEAREEFRCRLTQEIVFRRQRRERLETVSRETEKNRKTRQARQERKKRKEQREALRIGMSTPKE